jgi:phenylacetate-CoA ligase
MLIGAGVRPRDRLTLLGPLRTGPRRLHRQLGLYRMEMIPGNLPDQEMVRRLRESRPDVLWVYPTVLKTVLYRAGCALSGLARPRLLITSSQVMESVLRGQLLADLPEMEIATIYGSAEAGRIAAECRRRSGLHLEDDALIVELLENGSPVEPGREGTAALTCLDQFAMPLIRYEQGDRCRLRTTPCSCGWQTPVMDAPAGRSADMVTLTSGRKISILPFDAALRDQTDLLQYRFVQQRLDLIEAQLCYRSPPPDEHLRELRRRLEDAVPEQMKIVVRLVPAMRFEGVKFRVFVSELEGSS